MPNNKSITVDQTQSIMDAFASKADSRFLMLSATKTLLASAWTASGTKYVQSVTVSGITQYSNGIGVVSSTASVAQKEASVDANVYLSGQGTNSVTFTADSVPSMNIPVDIFFQGSGSGTKQGATYTPTTTDQVISAGWFLTGDQIIKGDSNLLAGNIKSGTTIFGVGGTFTSDADAVSTDILPGKTAYVNGAKVTGNMSGKTAETYIPTTTDQTIAANQYLSGAQTIKGDVDLVSGNIKKDVEIFGVTGSYSGTDTSDATATSDDMVTGKTAYVNGVKVTGTLGTLVDSYVEGGTLSKASDPTDLNVARYSLAATHVSDYALFGGGYSSNGSSSYPSAKVEAYNTSLTRSLPTDLNVARQRLAATTVGNYALFGGGSGSNGTSAEVEAYNTSLTRSLPTDLNVARYSLAATHVSDYALFGGGYSSNYLAEVDAYNTSLTRSLPTDLSVARDWLAATHVGDYALFGGGYVGGYSAEVEAYNTSLTRSLPMDLNVARYSLAATHVGSYALFGGGYGSDYLAEVEAYNTSLTRSLPTDLNVARYSLAATHVSDYALFGGGYSSNGSSSYPSAKVEAYNTSLTRSLPTDLNVARYSLAATHVSDYALFGGGYGNGNNYSAEVDAYTITGGNIYKVYLA